MCGIVGAHGTATRQSFDLSILKHRGPDHANLVQLQDMFLGHTRLSIVDVESGAQPLGSSDGRFQLICNGEVYNQAELRQQFPDYNFQTSSDNEVILPLYAKYGTDAIQHLNGMFAFVLYDTQTEQIYIGRDPIGIKPLYYGWKDKTLYFASELKALKPHLRHVQEFPPGHWYTHEEGLVCYYDLERVAADAVQQSEPSIDEIREGLRDAVQRRLMADVPLGVYLSGGLDSTIVAALVAEANPDVHSFAVGVHGSDDLENARRAAEALGTQHHEYVYTLEEMLEALPEIIYHLESFDPSLVRSAIPNYFLARMTRQYVTVVLTGEGADELYAGYHYLKAITDETGLRAELVKLTSTLYNCNLQRCDRMTMAHSIEARVPFLDTDFIHLSMRVRKNRKIAPDSNTEKWVLRKAFEGIVPQHVAWRTKEQFSKGAGSSEMLMAVAEERYDDATFRTEQRRVTDAVGRDIHSKEMLLYFHLFEQHFGTHFAELVQVWVGEDAV